MPLSLIYLPMHQIHLQARCHALELKYQGRLGALIAVPALKGGRVTAVLSGTGIGDLGFIEIAFW